MFLTSVCIMVWKICTQAGQEVYFFHPELLLGSVRTNWQTSKPKPCGKRMEKPLSIFPQMVQRLLRCFFIFSSLFFIDEREEIFQRDAFLAKCCHLGAPECNCVQILEPSTPPSPPPLPDRNSCTERKKCPFVQTADIFFIIHINSSGTCTAVVPPRPAFRLWMYFYTILLRGFLEKEAIDCF